MGRDKDHEARLMEIYRLQKRLAGLMSPELGEAVGYLVMLTAFERADYYVALPEASKVAQAEIRQELEARLEHMEGERNEEKREEEFSEIYARVRRESMSEIGQRVADSLRIGFQNLEKKREEELSEIYARIREILPENVHRVLDAYVSLQMAFALGIAVGHEKIGWNLMKENLIEKIEEVEGVE